MNFQIRSSIFCLSILICFSGCETGVSPENSASHSTLSIPKKWKAATIPQPPYQADPFWIWEFNDPELNKFVRTVLCNNKDLKSAESRIRIAANDARVVGADVYPRLGVTLDGERRKQNFIGFPDFGGFTAPSNDVVSTTANRFSLLFDLQWEIDLWGVVKAEHGQAIANLEASQHDKAALELSLAAQSVRSWFIIAESAEQVVLAKRILGTFKNTQESVQERFELGLERGSSGFGSQLLLAKTDVASAEEALAARQELVLRTSRQLEILAGTYPSGEVGQKARLPAFPKKRPISVPCQVIQRRPDIIAAERRLAAADLGLVRAQRALYPTLNITSDVGTTAEMISDLLDGDFSVYSLAADIARPIFQGGRIKAAQQRVFSELDLAKNEYERVVLNAFGEIENALTAEKFLALRVEAMRKAATFSQQAYDRSVEEYIAGTGDLLTMLTAQQRLFSQESQLLSMKRQQLEARVNLHLALAGSFECIERINADPLPIKL